MVINMEGKRLLKTLITASLISAITTGFTACNRNTTSGDSSDMTPAETTVNVTVAETTVETAETSAVSSETSAETSGGDNQQAGTETAKIKNAIAAAYGEDYLPNTEITSEMLESEFGLKADMYDEITAEMPMIGFHPDRVVVVKAKSGMGDKVKAALEKARETKINDANQYPANLAKTSVAKVLNNGDIYCFLIAGAPDDTSENEDAAMKFAEEQIQKGVDAFNNYFKQ